MQSDVESTVNATTATTVQDKEQSADTTTSSSENTSPTSPGEVLESKEEGTKSSDPNLFTYLGLVKKGADGKQSPTTAVEASPSVPNNPGGEELLAQKETLSTDTPGQSSDLNSRETTDPEVEDDPAQVTKISVRKDKRQQVDEIPCASSSLSEIGEVGTTRTPPRFIKLNLDQSKETIICCPVAL